MLKVNESTQKTSAIPKVFLGLSLTAFLLSFTGPGSELGGGVLRPFSAICFGLFLVTLALAGETAAYDAEQRENLRHADDYERLLRAARAAHSQESSPARPAAKENYAKRVQSA